jgi:hypothetical protein
MWPGGRQWPGVVAMKSCCDRCQLGRTGAAGHGSRGIYGVGSPYQVTTSEDTVLALENHGVCESAIAL